MSLQTEEIYRTLLLYSADAVIVTNPAGIITTTNPSFAKLVGSPIEELIGSSLDSIVVADWQEVEESENGKEQSKQEEEEESALKTVTVLTRVGTEFVMPAAHFPVYHDTKKAELAGYLTIIYVIQANSLQQAQTEFVSTVSHELRTPLTSIKGFADTILRAGERMDSSQQRR